MIDVVSVFVLGGLILMLGAYVIAITSKWPSLRRLGNYMFWIGMAFVLIGYFQMHQFR